MKFVKTTSLLFFLFVFSPFSARAFDTATLVEVVARGTSISVGGQTSCLLDGVGARCNNKILQQALEPWAKVPISQLSTGSGFICFISEDKLHCVSTGSSTAMTPPEIEGVLGVSASWNFACGIGTKGLHCWGTLDPSIPSFVPMNDLALISTGSRHVCAASRNQMQCWGGNGWGQAQPMQGTDIRALVSGSQHNCLLDSTSLRCNGDKRFGLSSIPKLDPKTIFKMTAAGGSTCILTHEKTHCWGYDMKSLSPLNDKMNLALSLGPEGWCSFGEGFLSCRSFIGTPSQLPFSLENKPFWFPVQPSLVAYYLKAIAKHTYSARARVIENLGATLTTGSSHALEECNETGLAKLLALRLAAPFIESATSLVLTELIRPHFFQNLHRLNKLCGQEPLLNLPRTRSSLVYLAGFYGVLLGELKKYPSHNELVPLLEEELLALANLKAQLNINPNTAELFQSFASFVNSTRGIIDKLPDLDPYFQIKSDLIQLEDIARGIGA